MTSPPTVAWPSEDSIRRHADLDHGFGADRVERTPPGLLIFEHDRAHREFTTFKAPHRHRNVADGAEVAAMTDLDLAAALDRLPLGGYASLVAGVAADRLRDKAAATEQARILGGQDVTIVVERPAETGPAPITITFEQARTLATATGLPATDEARDVLTYLADQVDRTGRAPITITFEQARTLATATGLPATDEARDVLTYLADQVDRLAALFPAGRLRDKAADSSEHLWHEPHSGRLARFPKCDRPTASPSGGRRRATIDAMPDQTPPPSVPNSPYPPRPPVVDPDRQTITRPIGGR